MTGSQASVAKPTKKEQMQIKELTELLKNQEMRLTEVETEYEVYKTKA